MRKSARIYAKATLFIMSGLFSVPTLGYGGYLLACWIRIHTSNIYYADYWYATIGLAFVAVGLLSLCAALYGASRRSFYGLLFVAPVFLGLSAMINIPELLPHAYSSIADSNYLSGVRAFLEDWYENNHRFPTNESEFQEALRKGPAAWQYRVDPVPASRYMQRGSQLPYQIVVVTNANAPKTADVSRRPGVVYYCVSSDLQEFWVTMTRLQSDLAVAASLKPFADRPEEEYWVVHAAGHDYPARKQ
ncbi:MAG: hypothetical protein WCC22_16055 [Terriglobales bacterium]